jgi:hypothetical protein
VDSLSNGTALRLHGGGSEWSSSIRWLISWRPNALEIGGFFCISAFHIVVLCTVMYSCVQLYSYKQMP